MTVFTQLQTPIGNLLVARDAEGLREIRFEREGSKEPDPSWTRDDEALAEPVEQLKAYFAGELRNFDLLLAPEGTPFQLSVWSALSEIPYGETTSYGAVAEKIGRPSASRAVGAANGANPLPIVLPCHRVIGSNGALVGFGGGLDVKEALLDAERHRVSDQTELFETGAR
jgi:methylated-DNA-[protein]-cysteine S-methyltransferase